ncbi:class I SAM-dependent methyltransferase [Roseobacter sinensis]|uniref:Class I SAM-dependent methyltransferase n=1 Tax=Roseobacter sinensis TaxID=2931391 RepID=A0ABT3BB67_9RHOB|nr:class I SAM-dependent methyltransferase [Roseobacter sp. WL0113]MCV3270813.1 class I SAM-dependent methyltransferase [Roseobacter sp. WL0113]
MSRLDSMRRRITAQIDGINWAAEAVTGLEGDVLELGLGNGRTYDHLRERLPHRRIWVIDRVLQPHPSCIPPAECFLEGEADAMLLRLAKKGVRIALAHYDFGFGVKDKDVAEGARLSPLIAPLMVPGGLIVSQQPLTGFDQICGPATVAADRYHFYRAP